MEFFGTFEGENFEDYAKAIDNWVASCKQLADGNLKIQLGNPDGSIKIDLSDKLDSTSKEFKKCGDHIRDGFIDALAVSEAYKQYKEKNDTDDIFKILHMSLDDTVDFLDDMASEMDAEIGGSSIDELKEKLPYLVALRKSIKLINGFKHLIDDLEKPCR